MAGQQPPVGKVPQVGGEGCGSPGQEQQACAPEPVSEHMAKLPWKEQRNNQLQGAACPSSQETGPHPQAGSHTRLCPWWAGQLGSLLR